MLFIRFFADSQHSLAGCYDNMCRNMPPYISDTTYVVAYIADHWGLEDYPTLKGSMMGDLTNNSELANNAQASIGRTRRKLFFAVAAGTLIPVMKSYGAGLPGDGGLSAGSTGTVSLREAMEFLLTTPYRKGDVITKPVSLLQRHYKLGYSKACLLASTLERAGFWLIFIDADGIRAAKIRQLPR